MDEDLQGEVQKNH